MHTSTCSISSLSVVCSAPPPPPPSTPSGWNLVPLGLDLPHFPRKIFNSKPPPFFSMPQILCAFFCFLKKCPPFFPRPSKLLNQPPCLILESRCAPETSILITPSPRQNIDGKCRCRISTEAPLSTLLISGVVCLWGGKSAY